MEDHRMSQSKRTWESTVARDPQHQARIVRVVAWFPSGEEGTRQANEYMEKNPDVAVVADHEGLILLARTKDRGIKLQD